ncbi:hypothetical protein [Pseudomonas huaxiensis]|uniref:hypothetical protein n=1 Tax=Pseudomonas huaxiensis TaxID=2213017 RepID=UPI000DA65019|nr:hypothetical protein [Pseudomonas huaxiensis]
MAGVDEIVLKVSQLTKGEELNAVTAAVNSRLAALRSAETDAAMSKYTDVKHKELKGKVDLNEILKGDSDPNNSQQ